MTDLGVQGGTAVSEPNAFEVSLVNFEGPFDLLLQLISKHQLDITEVALSAVTAEFIAFTRQLDDDLEQTTHFLLVAATLLDLKAARLLPQAEVEDEEDLALLEARDLLFARLIQYRAFKEVASLLGEWWDTNGARHPRSVPLEPRFANALPEVQMNATPQDLADLAAQALTPKAPPVLSLAHLHAPVVSVREQANLMVDRLRRERVITFRSLVADAPDMPTKVARFLAVLELFRENQIAFEQVTPLGELTITWTGSDSGDVNIGDEYDDSADPEEKSDGIETPTDLNDDEVEDADD